MEVKEYNGERGNCVNQTVTRKTADLLSSGSTLLETNGRIIHERYREKERERHREEKERGSKQKRRSRRKEREEEREISWSAKGWGQGGSRIESLCLLGEDHRP